MPQDIDTNSEAKSSPLKAFLKSLLRRVGFDIVRYQPTGARPINILDLAVRARLVDNPDFLFLQVGANDGVRHDPIRDLVLEFQLRGILLEPLPDMFEELRANYACQPQLQLVNAAVSAGEEHLTLARFRADAPVHDDLHGLASIDIGRIEEFARDRGLLEYVEQVQVECVTFEQLAADHDIASLDLLMIDVEGHEWELLQAAFQAGLKPVIVFMEFLHLSPLDRWNAEQLLADRGYDVTYTGIDLVGVQPFGPRRAEDSGSSRSDVG